MRRTILLDKNESPYPPSLSVLEIVRKYVTSINRYDLPELRTELVKALSDYVGLSEEFLEILPGSEAFSVYFGEVFRQMEYTLVYSSPTFMPAVENMILRGVRVIDIPLNKEFRIDVEAVLSNRGKNSAIYIVNPNNPTGNLVIGPGELKAILEVYDFVILDETYYEFSNVTYSHLIKHFPNLIIIRTFSKAFAIAGARIGYIIANPAVQKQLLKTRREFDVSVLSMAAALGALQDIEYMKRLVSRTIKLRDTVVRKLNDLEGVTAVNTLTNFILVKKDGFDSRSLYNELAKRDVYVKPLEGCLNQYVRVTVGTEEEMMIFKKLMEMLG